MTMLLNKIETTRTHQRVLKFDIGRTLAVVLSGLGALIVAAFLWSSDHNAPAFAVFQLGEGILIGGLGVSIGERRAAKATDLVD